ncbi:agmatinase [Pilimelia terevasa]|uniref:Agmatinase n=1 Tax=Pilimelia terevasa TaxID=53372 RepID=A0A8J3FET7_9ACTN|nr:agmatinase [Pilimelia terevasa]GGK17246.1 agmatinase [Pilimelia terevasa]
MINGRPTPVGPPDATHSPRYVNATTFARLPRLDQVPRADIAVVGVPFDSGVTYRPGARFGPNHVRQSSMLLRPYHHMLDLAPLTEFQIADAGDIPVNPFDMAETIESITQGARDLLATGARLMTIGGDHSIAFPLLRAVAEKHGPVAVVHFDAHLDTWDIDFGQCHSHGTPFRRAAEAGYLDRDHCLHIGIRGPQFDKADLTADADLGFEIVYGEWIDDLGIDGVVERMRARLGDRPVYVSVDIDVLDPAFAPGTGTPECGGLSSRELLAILRGMAGLNVVSADLVEVAPAYDHAEITGMAGARVSYELISVMAAHLAGIAPTPPAEPAMRVATPPPAVTAQGRPRNTAQGRPRIPTQGPPGDLAPA